MKCAIEHPCRGEVVAEGFFDDHSPAFRTAGLRQPLCHDGKQRRWNRQVVQRPSSATQRLTQAIERCRVLVVAGDVL